VTEPTEHATYTLDFVVRRAQATDAEALARLWQESAELLAAADRRWRMAPDGVAQWSAAFTAWLGRDDGAVFVAERKGHALGYVIGGVVPNRPGFDPAQIGAVIELAIDSHGRGDGGIGTQLIAALTAWLTTRGVSQLEVRVPTAQPIAQAFWRASGATVMANEMWLKVDKRESERKA
jgi:L-amino acid N-acyltransferase YncA